MLHFRNIELIFLDVSLRSFFFILFIFVLVKKKGYYFYYDEDGQKLTGGYLKDGKENGEKITYFEGKVHFSETFKNGKRNGLSKYYNLDGIKDREGIYKNGKKSSKKKYCRGEKSMGTNTYRINREFKWS